MLTFEARGLFGLWREVLHDLALRCVGQSGVACALLFEDYEARKLERGGSPQQGVERGGGGHEGTRIRKERNGGRREGCTACVNA